MFEILLVVFALVAFATARKTRERLALIERQMAAFDARIAGIELAAGGRPPAPDMGVPAAPPPIAEMPEMPAAPAEPEVAEAPAAPPPPSEEPPPPPAAARPSWEEQFSAPAGWCGSAASPSRSAAFFSCATRSSAD
jgi:type IV secretory pathway VirB10-like protein